MNRKAYWSVLCVIFIMALAACGGNGTKTPPPTEIISVTSGSGQSAVINTAFANPLVATVSTGGVPNAGVAVTFTAPGSGASGTFNSGSTTAMVTTDANGVATSPAFTANSTTGGPYIVTAAAAGVSANVNFTLTNTAAAVASSQFSFYFTGLEGINDGPNFYAVAGSVTIDANGDVLGGEQDYNDAFGLTSPEPSGDSITGGTLTTTNSALGMATLTLITNNPDLGVSGTETLGVQYVNANHALVIQFDGSATSSGSLDLQTIPNPLAPPSGSFSFTVTGVDPSYEPIVGGGVFSISGTSLTNGMFDLNNNGVVTLGTPFTGTVSVPDSFGRGSITNSILGTTTSYYIVGPEAFRVVDMDVTDSGLGLAFGQGTAAGTFTNASLGASVFSLESNSWGLLYAAAGQITTTPGSGGSGTVQGVGDDDEEGTIYSGVTIGSSGSSYEIPSTGYGSMILQPGALGDISELGVYMVDPTLNILDPNNTTTGLGGALVAELDSALGGTGVMLPQTETSTTLLAGDYAFGAQGFFGSEGGWEFDLVGEGTFSSGVLAGSGIVSDPFDSFGGPAADSDVGYTGTATPDIENVGRYTMFSGPFVVSISGGEPFDLDTVIYQANGGQLVWMEEDENSLFAGTIQQFTLEQPAVKKKVTAKLTPKQK
jgi:hypothetical protein